MRAVFILTFFITLIFGSDKMSIYDFEAKKINGKTVSMSQYKGNVMLIVNVASKCGFTSQYAGLQKLHEKYSSKGLSILGFPCNQFMNQEPASEKEIASFCSLNYGVSFDMFSKIDVNGDDAHPLYKYLTSKSSGLFGTEFIKWNFTKFLIDRDGNIIKRFGPSTTPSEIEDDIRALL